MSTSHARLDEGCLSIDHARLDEEDVKKCTGTAKNEEDVNCPWKTRMSIVIARLDEEDVNCICRARSGGCQWPMHGYMKRMSIAHARLDEEDVN